MKKIIIIVLVILFIWKCGCSNDSDKSSSYTKTREWYKGGTLHKVKIIDWKSATERNKLATCADFIYATNKNLSFDEIKKEAIDLRICINEAVREQEVSDQYAVSEIAALCLTLLKN